MAEVRYSNMVSLNERFIIRPMRIGCQGSACSFGGRRAAGAARAIGEGVESEDAVSNAREKSRYA
jgi:hypothetical protein